MAEAQWYYLELGEQKGPVSAGQLLEMVAKKILTPTTKVWSPTATQGWEPINEIAQFRKQIGLSSLMPADTKGHRRAFAPVEATDHTHKGIWADHGNDGPVTTQKRGFNFVGLALILLLAGSLALAFMFKSSIEEKFPTLFSKLYFEEAVIRCKNNDNDNALTEFKQVIKLDPTKAEAYFHKGATEIKMGNTRDAWPDFQQALKINPNYVPGYLGVAYLEADTGNLRAAIEDLNKALVINDKFADAYYARGLMREKLGSRAGALVDLQSAAKLFEQQHLDGKLERTNKAIGLLQAADKEPSQPAPDLKWLKKGDCLAHDLKP